jgi:dGTPase
MARALRLNEDLAEAIALSHDLGHTPFGHAGERALAACMAPFCGFDHNVQAMRVVTLLENRYAEHDGLNLTWETLEGILKHNGPLTNPDGTPYGRYAREGLPDGIGELPAVADLRPSSFASLEAQCAAIADDIAYNAHDIDDALRARLITLDHLRDVPLAGPIVPEVLGRYPDAPSKRQAHEVQRRLITRSIEDVIVTTAKNIKSSGVQSPEDVRTSGRTLVTFSPAMAEAEQGLKTFLFDRVYRHETVMAPVRQSEIVVTELFQSYMANRDLPGRWGVSAMSADEPALARTISDFIAGMTDPYAMEEHARLFDGG